MRKENSFPEDLQMVDPSHLEKMGRELKCPICLSLLNSAVSLTCNHVFCNACIMKSMKSGSTCPVCKVPYRRREVRLAPHMDNLVSIYKSMEIASGFNIFVTQNPPQNEQADDEKRVENDLNCSERAGNQGANQRRGSRAGISTENSDPIPVKPSFPTNKRVQVPQYPLSETPVPSSKLGCALVESTEDESKRSSDFPKENYILREKGEPMLSPFFWLREEDVEKPSQLTDGDQCVFTTPPDVPSFSDLNDSDDREEVHGNTDHVHLFDSEMFEWTQRACSPELLSSPVKKQLADDDEPALQGSNTIEDTCRTARNDASNGMLPNLTSLRTKTTNNKIRSHKSAETGRKHRKISQKKIATSSRISRDHVDPGKGSEDFDQNGATDRNCSSYLAKSRKNSKAAGLDDHETEAIVAYVSVASVIADPPDENDTNMVSTLPTRAGKEKRSGDEGENLKTGKTCRGSTARCQKKSSSKSKKQKRCVANVDIPEEVSTIHNQTNEKMILEKSLLPIPVASDNCEKHFSEGSIKRAREVKSAMSLKSEKNLRCKKKMKVSFSGDTKNLLAEDHQKGNRNVSPGGLGDKVRDNPTVGVSDGSTVKLPLVNGAALRKCETITNKIQCAFCLSTEDSEASGEMVHYYDGGSVPLDYNGSSKTIHSHKNCTEWAPNVYFENDKAINLEAELSRSRKIKCSCCGLKGAALGCYEKSCRKSFHVPCAKLVSQCRWDTENFVMLCPLHASSKLPNENSESQGSRKRRVLRGHLPSHHNEVPINKGISVQKKWNPCESHKKLILCCSALAVREKEIIAEFQKLSGVTVLKICDPSVTHIIASTDENGACKRTLKVLMGILEGKWILNINWVKACIKAMKPADELQYEITLDVHGIRDGPRLGRLRLQNKQPKIFDGFKFYMMGDFEPSYKGYLQDLIIAAGGVVLHRKPISGYPAAPLASSLMSSSTLIIYSVELPDDKYDPTMLSRRQSDAEALASSTQAKAVSNLWVLNSISACKLQNLSE